MKLTVEQVYNKLVNDDKILTKKGQITFTLGDIDIIVKQRDVVGNIMQEWIEGWLKKNNIDYSLNDNTQMPPDFYLDPENKKEGLMEIKAFNYKGSPGFDIADFRMYAREISEKPWMLNVTYLIFGYDMSDDGIVTIKQVWQKKVWEMSRPMKSGNNKTIWKVPYTKCVLQNGMEKPQVSPSSKTWKTSWLRWKKLCIRTKILVMMLPTGFRKFSTVMKSIMV